MRINLLFFILSTTAAGSSIVYGQIVSTTGAVVVTVPPSNVSSNQWESNTQIRAFAEEQNLTLTQNVATDISVAGASPSATSENLSPSTIAAGTTIDSVMLHFDKVGSNSTVVGATGSITFAEPILGLLVLSDSENATNSILGLPGVTYSTGGDHGLGLNPGGGGNSDSVTLSDDLRTVTVDLNTNYYADDLRIVTAVPEPATLTMAATLAYLVQKRRRRVNR